MRFSTSAFAVLACGLVATAVLACSDTSNTSEPSGATGTDESSVNEDIDVFANPDALAVKISAPLSTLFTRFKTRQADPPDANAAAGQVAEFSEPGQLVFTHGGEEKSLDLRVYVRGESSRNDCPFTKLKIEFTDKSQLKKTPFKGHTKMRLNTHCGPGDASARSGMGRVFNGVGPVREELTYRLIRAAGIPTYRTRVVAVHYDDTADATQIDSFGMLVESGDDAAQRFAKMDPPLIAPDAEYLDPNAARGVRITPENTAQIVIAEGFAGNKDWGGVHNIDTFAVVGGTDGLQIAQDFDLCAITMGDIARYRIAPITDARTGLANAIVAASIRPKKDAMESAYREAEKAMIAARAIATDDGTTTTDPGFLEAKNRINQLFEFPELNTGAEAPPTDAGAD